MSWLTEHQRLIGRCAWVAAWVGLVVRQPHALSRFATTEGAEDLARPAHGGVGRAGRAGSAAAAGLADAGTNYWWDTHVYQQSIRISPPQRNGLHALGVGDDRVYFDHGLTGTRIRNRQLDLTDQHLGNLRSLTVHFFVQEHQEAGEFHPCRGLEDSVEMTFPLDSSPMRLAYSHGVAQTMRMA